MALNALQLREVFHLVFLRAMVRAVPPDVFALKGGTNLRFYFGSIRYSEGMDIDIHGISVEALAEKAMGILESATVLDTMRTYGVADLRLPDLKRAKQTETVQRFKVGLLTPAGDDLATKVEFSRRGMDQGVRPETVSPEVLAPYRMAPIIIPHYTARTAALQKARALASRAHPQARDVFDLYLLSTQPDVLEGPLANDLERDVLERARQTAYELRFEQYRDTVVSFLGAEDRARFDSIQIWDEIRLTAVGMLERDTLDDG